jgi:drug/metabolite transporter (DMT)-like permease
MPLPRPPARYAGIFYMLVAALGFSVMGGFAKMLKPSFNAPQLVFYRNLTGLLVLLYSFWRFPVQQTGGKLKLLVFRGLMGTIALYTLLYNVLHIPLGTALTYNTTNTLFIALLSWVVLKEKLSPKAWFCILLGFVGVILINKPSVDMGWKYHVVGLICGVSSAVAYLSVSSLNKYYDTRVIVLSFILSGILLPLAGMLLGLIPGMPHDEFLVSEFRLPVGIEWFYVAGMGLAALMGQYFVTKAYGHDKAGVVSAIGYSNIVFALLIGLFLGDAFPDVQSLMGILLVMVSGVLISLNKK